MFVGLFKVTRMENPAIPYLKQGLRLVIVLLATAFIPGFISLSAFGQESVVMEHNDTQRTGVNLAETL